MRPLREFRTARPRHPPRALDSSPIDQFGELKSNMKIEKLNEFLDKNVDDKKLAERDDYEDLKKGKKKKKK